MAKQDGLMSCATFIFLIFFNIKIFKNASEHPRLQLDISHVYPGLVPGVPEYKNKHAGVLEHFQGAKGARCCVCLCVEVVSLCRGMFVCAHVPWLRQL